MPILAKIPNDFLLNINKTSSIMRVSKFIVVWFSSRTNTFCVDSFGSLQDAQEFLKEKACGDGAIIEAVTLGNHQYGGVSLMGDVLSITSSERDDQWSTRATVWIDFSFPH